MPRDLDPIVLRTTDSTSLVAGAFLHRAIIGPGWYRFFNADERFAR